MKLRLIVALVIFVVAVYWVLAHSYLIVSVGAVLAGLFFLCLVLFGLCFLGRKHE